MGVVRAVGIVLLVLGLLTFVTGAIAFGAAYASESGNQREGCDLLVDCRGRDDTSRANQGIAEFAVASLGAGLLLTLVGLILVVVGRSRPTPPMFTVVPVAVAAPVTAVAPPDPVAHERKASSALVVGVAGAIALVLLVALLSRGSFGSLLEPDEAVATGMLDAWDWEATLRGYEGAPAQEQIVAPFAAAAFETPAGSSEVRLSLERSQGPGGAGALSFALHVREDEGWREVARQEGAGKLELAFSDSALAERDLQWTVEAAEPGFVAQQRVSVHVEAWAPLPD